MEIEKTEAWIAFCDMRKAKGKRAPFTDYAKTRILFELRRLQADGQDPEEVLWTSVTNGWSGVFAIRKQGWHAPSLSQTIPSVAVEKSQEWIKAHGAESHQEQTPQQKAEISARLKTARERIARAS